MLPRFDSREHIQNLLDNPVVSMFDDLGRLLDGIRGIAGAVGVTSGGVHLGIDEIVMSPGSAFPLHVHEGDHILYVLRGTCGIHVDGVDYPLSEGDSIYVPAIYPHGVRGPESGMATRILAFGVPHHPIDSTTRMTLVNPAVPYDLPEPA